MVKGWRKQTLLNENSPSFPHRGPNSSWSRNLSKHQLGGVIFGCKNTTITECFSNQLFGLPSHHFSYVKKIDQGLPVFLFNYNDRKLHGIFEAAGSGHMNINPYAWTDGSQKTPYPAQVQIRVRHQCHPLLEDQFKEIIMDNYYNRNCFWFELDHVQTSLLISKLASLAITSRTYTPLNTELSTTKPLEASSSCQREAEYEKDYFYLKLKEWFVCRENADATTDEKVIETALSDYSRTNCETEDANTSKQIVEIAPLDDAISNRETSLAARVSSEKTKDKNDRSCFDSSDHSSLIEQLLHQVEELTAVKTEQTQKMHTLEQKLVEAEKEIQQLNSRFVVLESLSNPSTKHAVGVVAESLEEIHLDISDSIFLIGGYNGEQGTSAVDLYSPSLDAVKSLGPMNSVRSFGSVANLNGELYVFGGGNGPLMYDTVESYNPAQNEWTLRPSLNGKRGGLAGVTLGDKIFALGGGDGVEDFSSVEIFDPYVGCWIPTQSMLQKRFSLAAMDLNGAIYAVGGYDGKAFLKSAERFDPREHSWTRIESMGTSRSCHSLVVMNEKLYALGGTEGGSKGSEMLPSVEIYDPRLGKWMMGEPLNQGRAYFSAAVLKDTIYVIAGLKSAEEMVDTVECYKEGEGWKTTNLIAAGRRCFSSTIVLTGE